MKRKLAWLLGVVALIASIICLSIFQPHHSHTVISSHDRPAAHALRQKSACELFTSSIAYTQLGSRAQKIDASPSGQASTEDMRISSCAYEAGTGGSVSSLTVRAALNRAAYGTNVLGFQSTRAAAADQGLDTHMNVMSQYHTAAYYNATFKQLHILVHHGQYWLIVQADGGKAKTEQLAHAIMSQL